MTGFLVKAVNCIARLWRNVRECSDIHQHRMAIVCGPGKRKTKKTDEFHLIYWAISFLCIRQEPTRGEARIC